MLALGGLSLLALLGMLGPWAGSGPPPQPPSTDAQHAQRLEDLSQRFSTAIQNQRDTTAMIDEARRLVDSDADSAPARLLLAQILMRNGRVDQAVEHLQRCLQIDPDQPQTRQMLGSVMMELGEYAAAQSHYAQAIDLRPRDAGSRLLLAAASLANNDLDEARDAALIALKLDPDQHKAHMLLSQVFEKQGHLALAESQMARALDLLPDTQKQLPTRVAYARRRAAMLRRANRPAEALAALRQMPPAQLYTPDVAKDMATTYAMLDEPGMAAAHYETMVQIDPSNDDAAAKAADWHLRAGDTEAARAMLQKLRSINPRHEAIPDLDAKLRSG